VVLPGAVRERARVGAGPDHRGLVDVRVPARAGRLYRRPVRAPRGLLQHAGPPVGVIPATARPGRVIHGSLRPPILDGLAAFVADALPGH